MSWFARSLANSLRLDDAPTAGSSPSDGENDEDDPTTPSHGRGVKEDLSELKQTLTKQLWGVASFLAPPPQDPNPKPNPDPEPSDSPRIAGIRSDFAEIGGRFRSGISILSSNKAVEEISKIASTFLPFGEEEEEEGEGEGSTRRRAVGVTEDVILFARNISMHPETWLEFPLLSDDARLLDDFEMTDAQQEHALVVENFAPRLAALRIELCPSHMSERCFWKIYFVLLHPRLSKEESECLSTTEIVEARARLLQELQRKTKPENLVSNLSCEEGFESPKDSVEHTLTAPSGDFSHGSPLATTRAANESSSFAAAPNFETEKHPVAMTEIKIVDKSVIGEEKLEEKNSSAGANKSLKPVIGEEKLEEKNSPPDANRSHKSVIGEEKLEEKNSPPDANKSHKSVIGEEKLEEKNSTPDANKSRFDKFEDENDEWLREDIDTIEIGNRPKVTSIPICNDEDVSFSDLEDEEEDRSSHSKNQPLSSQSSATDSTDWVRLRKSNSEPHKNGKTGNMDTKDSNEWLNIDDFDEV